MSTTPQGSSAPTDAFVRFWTDLVTRMATAGFSPPAGGFGFAPGATGGAPGAPAAPTPDAIKQMQRIFFDAYAKYADEFMRSPQFLEALKQSMDGALTFKRQMDAFLAGSLKAGQMPSQAEWVASATNLAQTQNKILQRLEQLSQRVDALDGRGDASATRRAGPAATGRAPSRKSTKAAPKGRPAARRAAR